MKRGLFITFEGGEGAGKSSQVKNLARWLREEGYAVITTREPGGSPGAEAVRHVLLSGAAETFGPRMEALLFAAARADHVEHVIRPALERGTMVLCDRFMDSTRVYQGITGNLDAGYISTLEHVSVADLVPDLTIICDLDPEEGLRRASERRGIDTPDRFEKESTEIHRLRREAFLDIAAEESGRCVVIDAGRDFESAAADIEAVIRKLLHAHDQNSNPPQDEAIS